jgi:hypothetical protein
MYELPELHQRLSVEQELMPTSKLQHGLRQAFEEAGYMTEEDILKLIQEVKEEMAAEQFQSVQDGF